MPSVLHPNTMSRAIPLGGAEILVNRLDGALKLEVEADGEVYAFTKMGDESSDDIRSLLGESASGADNLAIEIQGLKEGGRLRIYFRTPQRPAPLKVEQMNAPVAVMKIEEADDSDVPLMRKRKLAVSPERPLKKPRRVAPDRVRFYCYNSVEHFALGIMSFDLKSGEITWKPENPNKGVGIRGSSFGRVPVEIPVQKCKNVELQLLTFDVLTKHSVSGHGRQVSGSLAATRDNTWSSGVRYTCERKASEDH